MIVIAVALIASSLGKRVDMNWYLKVEATGYNGYGKLDYDFDYVTFAKRVLGDKNAGAMSRMPSGTMMTTISMIWRDSCVWLPRRSSARRLKARKPR